MCNIGRVLLTAALCFGGWVCGAPVETSRASAKALAAPDARQAGFSFAILGDRTTAYGDSLKITEQAVGQLNRLGPRFVMNVGDMLQGYDDRARWVAEYRQYERVMSGLKMPWYPTAGNHDVYWLRNTQGRPPEHHEATYEEHFGPLWYAFEYGGCRFIVLYSDEGDPASGQKGATEPALQMFSREQLEWLDKMLKAGRQTDHIFVFLHHPRWMGRAYGEHWDKVHAMLRENKNVSAVFAGHFHRMDYSRRDGIDYYILGTTGGTVSAYAPDRRHVVYWVTVDEGGYTVSAMPVDVLIDPQTYRTRTVELIRRQDWQLEADRDTLEWELSTAEHDYMSGWAEIMLFAEANAGGSRMKYALLDENRNKMHDGVVNISGERWISLPVLSGKRYYLQVAREPGGPAAGRRGRVEVSLRYYQL